MGGKSRKKGMVSRKLIQKLKRESGISDKFGFNLDLCESGKPKKKVEEEGLFNEMDEAANA